MRCSTEVWYALFSDDCVGEQYDDDEDDEDEEDEHEKEDDDDEVELFGVLSSNTRIIELVMLLVISSKFSFKI